MNEKGVLDRPVTSGMEGNGSYDSKMSGDGALRRVDFDQSVRVILIPSRDEYRKVGLYGALWWSGFEFSQFQASAHNEIRALALEEGIGARAARRKLYQPSLDENGKWGETKSRDSENSMIINNMLRIEEPDPAQGQQQAQSETKHDSLTDQNENISEQEGLGTSTQSPTESLKATSAREVASPLRRNGESPSAQSPPRLQKRTFDIANYDSEEILSMMPVTQNMKLTHVTENGNDSSKASTTGEESASADESSEVVDSEGCDDGSVHTDSDTDREEEKTAGERSRRRQEQRQMSASEEDDQQVGERNFMVSEDEEDDVTPLGGAPSMSRMHRTSSLQEISSAVKRSDSLYNLRKQKKLSQLSPLQVPPDDTAVSMDCDADDENEGEGDGDGNGEDSRPLSQTPQGDIRDSKDASTERSLHSVVTSRAPFSPSVPASSSSSTTKSSHTASGDETRVDTISTTGKATKDDKENGVKGGVDESKTKAKKKFVRSSSSSHSLGGGYDPDSWEALLLSVPMRKPAVLDDMSSKRRGRFSSHDLWKQKGFVGATIDFLGLGSMGPWRMLGWVVVACSMYIITTDASSAGGAAGGVYGTAAADLGAKVLGNDNVSF